MASFTLSKHTRSLAIVGAGGHGCVVADTAVKAGIWTRIVFYDDCYGKIMKCRNWDIVGTIDNMLEKKEDYSDYIVGIGDNRNRVELSNQIQENDLPITSIIHPDASVSSDCKIGLGCVILAGAVINIGSEIGQFCIINNLASVNHDCHIARGVHVGPNAALGGNVTVGKNTWIGIGASVKHGLIIGDNSTIGAGAAVTKNVDSGVTVVGVPARPIQNNQRNS